MTEVTEDIGGLPTGGRRIYYRLQADNGVKVVTGETESFKTVPTTITRKYLHDNTSDVVRRAREGESFTVKIDGSPAASLGPLNPTLLQKLAAPFRRKR